MPWPFTPSGSSGSGKDDKSGSASGSDASSSSSSSKTPSPPLPPTESSKKPISWNDSLNAVDWEHFKEPRNWIPTVLVTATALASLQIYRSYLRRIPGADHIQPGFFRRRSLLGRVTSVGDGDNFHLFHTPGGRLAGWGWLRKIPTEKKELKGRTIPIRIAGIDAPEGAHFGRPAQPFAAEALQWLSSYILHRPVRAYIYKRDQYERVVATVFVRRALGLVRRDVGLEMLRRGLATTYEAKSGAEFGGPAVEQKYRAAEAEARSKGRGMWKALEQAGKKKGLLGLWGEEVVFETPREFKTRVMNEAEKSGKGGDQKTP